VAANGSRPHSLAHTLRDHRWSSGSWPACADPRSSPRGAAGLEPRLCERGGRQRIGAIQLLRAGKRCDGVGHLLLVTAGEAEQSPSPGMPGLGAQQLPQALDSLVRPPLDHRRARLPV